MLKENLTPTIIKEKVSQFLKNNGTIYTEEEKKIILDNCLMGLYTDFPDTFIRQVYAELDLMDPSHNIYLGFIKLLEKYHSLEKNIIEVGGGRLPILAKYISLRQKSGSITVYDPTLVIPSNIPHNMVLKRKRFTSDINHPQSKLIIGFMPEESTEEMLEYAYRTKSDFMIALSDILDEVDMYQQDGLWTNWQQGIICEATRNVERNGMGKLHITTLEKYDNPYPIIYNYKK